MLGCGALPVSGVLVTYPVQLEEQIVPRVLQVHQRLVGLKIKSTIVNRNEEFPEFPVIDLRRTTVVNSTIVYA